MLFFFLAASFYLYEFILQVAPSVMGEQIMQSFQISAEGFGLISAFYFYAYAPMQLPAGILFDRYGPRKLMTCALILCAWGSIFFASTDNVLTAALGRFLIGIGSAFSFIGVLVLISRWFIPSYFAILAGIAQSMSSAGAVFGEMPLAYLVEHIGWRNASFILAAIGFLLALLLALFVRDFPHKDTQTLPNIKLRDELNHLSQVCKHISTWITGSYACMIWTPIAVFAALWGVPFLKAKYDISTVLASGMCSMIWIGIGIGSPLFGWLSDWLKQRKTALAFSALLGLIASSYALYYTNLPLTWMYFILFLIGVSASGQTISFAVVRDNNSEKLVGTASGFNNLSVLIGGAIFQPVVGLILQKYGHWSVINGIHVYSLASYQKALSIMPMCYVGAFVVAVFFLKESHPLSSQTKKRLLHKI